MSVVVAGALVAAGVGAAGASGALGGAAVSPVGETEAQILADQQSMVGPLAQTNARWDPFINATQQQIAATNLLGAPATPGTRSSTVWIGPNGQTAANPPMVTLGGATAANGAPLGANPLGIKGGGQSVVAPGWTEQTTPGVAASPAVLGEVGELGLAIPQLNAIQNAAAAQTAASQIGEVANLGPAALAAIKAYNPAQTQMATTLQTQAQNQLNQNGALDPFTSAALGQYVAQGQAARGVGTGPSDADAVAYYQTANMMANRAANQQLASGVISQQASLYGDPFMQILGRSSGVSVPGANIGQTGPTALSTQNQQGALNTLGALGYNAQNQSNIGAQNTILGSIGALTGNSQNLGTILNTIGAGSLYNLTNTAGTGNTGAASGLNTPQAQAFMGGGGASAANVYPY